MSKVDYVLDWVVSACMQAGEPEFCTLQETYDQLSNIDGLGSFLSGQVLADMKNTVGHPLFNAPDKHTFVAHGPGSIKGLSAFWERKVTPSSFREDMMECRALVDPLIPEGFPKIDNQDFQSCLCEISKYWRVKEGGHARNRYFAR